MTSRSIIVLALVQFLELFVGILVTAALCQLSIRTVGSHGAEMPTGFGWALQFRDWGFCLLPIILAWTTAAVLLPAPNNWMRWSSRHAYISGLVLVAVFLLLSLFMCLFALLPLMPIVIDLKANSSTFR